MKNGLDFPSMQFIIAVDYCPMSVVQNANIGQKGFLK